MADVLPLVVIAIGLAAMVLAPVFSRRSAVGAPPALGDRAPERVRLLERKEQLVLALRELAEARAAGRLTEPEYATLKNRYETEAVGVMQRLEAPPDAPGVAEPAAGGPAPQPAGRGSLWKGLAWGAGVVVFLALSAFALTKAVAPRAEGGPVTGGLPGSVGGGVGGGVMGGSPGSGVDAGRLAELERRIAKDSNDVDALVEAGHLYLEQQRMAEAAAVSMKAIDLQHGQLEAHTHIGLILFSQGETDLALEVLNQVLRLRPGFPEALLYKGMVLFASGTDPAGAADAWEEYLKVAPPDADTVRVARLLEAARARAAGQ